MSSQSQSDVEDVGSSTLGLAVDEQLEIVKHELEAREEEQTTEDLFGNDILLPHANPISVKERRESKEKSKKELEEEEREKMQYVINLDTITRIFYKHVQAFQYVLFNRVLVSNFTEDQLDRYEMYRRAAFPKAAIKRVMYMFLRTYYTFNCIIFFSKYILYLSFSLSDYANHNGLFGIAKCCHCNVWYCKSVCRRNRRRRSDCSLLFNLLKFVGISLFVQLQFYI